MRALVQKHGGQFTNVSILTAFLGFREKGYLIEPFEFADIGQIALDSETIVVGGIPAIAAALARLGIDPPLIPSIPECLRAFAARRVWEGTLAEARDTVDAGRPLFIKPLPRDRKLFTGHVVANYRDLALTASLPGSFPVLCSDPVDMVSEYRLFVIRGKIVGCRHYKGDFREAPDFRVIDAALAAFLDAPSGYGIDFAITASGQTILVEVNEGLALGCYGLPPLPYSALIEARWEDFRSQ